MLEAECKGNEADAVIIAKIGDGSGEEIGKFSAKVKRDPLMGNVGLVCQPLPQPGKAKAKSKGKGGRNNKGRGFFKFWFQDLAVSGAKVEAHPGQTFGPILWSQYTVHDSILKLTAQFAPFGAGENQIAKLEIDKGDGWEFIDQAKLDPLARTAEFRIEYWDDTGTPLTGSLSTGRAETENKPTPGAAPFARTRSISRWSRWPRCPAWWTTLSPINTSPRTCAIRIPTSSSLPGIRSTRVSADSEWSGPKPRKTSSGRR